ENNCFTIPTQAFAFDSSTPADGDMVTPDDVNGSGVTLVFNAPLAAADPANFTINVQGVGTLPPTPYTAEFLCDDPTDRSPWDQTSVLMLPATGAELPATYAGTITVTLAAGIIEQYGVQLGGTGATFAFAVAPPTDAGP